MSKTLSALRLSDATLDHLTAYLSTFSGTDKGLMILQYAPLLLLPLLPSDAATKGLPVKRMGGQRVRLSLQRLSSVIADGRILFRLFGLVPILQWYRSLRAKRLAGQREGKRPESILSLSPERVEMFQAYSMLAYYPLEHAYYLASKKIIPLSDNKLLKVGVWSCRFWALYVVLSLLTLFRKRQSLVASRRDPKSQNLSALSKEEQTLQLQSLVDLSYLPLTAHWSLPAGLWTSSFPTGVFGTLAALGQLKLGWDASAPKVQPTAQVELAGSPSPVSAEGLNEKEEGEAATAAA